MFEAAVAVRWRRIGRSVALSLLAASLLAASTLAASEPMTQQLIVKFRDDGRARRALPVRSRLALLASDAATTLSYLRPMSLEAHVVALDHAVPLSEARAIAVSLATNADVEYAEADRWLKPSFVPNDDFINQQAYLSNGAAGISAFDAWDITTGSPDVVVAVVDTGFRPHAGLAGRFIQGYDFITDPTIANDGDGRDLDASDPGDWVTLADKDGPLRGQDCSVANSSWHGTAVSGVIGANGNDHAWTAGIDWSARILPVRVLGKCGGRFSDIIDGVAWAAGLPVPGAPTNATPAQVINMSLGDDSSSPCGAAEQSVFDAALAHGVTRAIVVSAGNDSDDVANHVPANCTGVISVGATTSTGNIAGYSNFGPTLTISAPGGQYPQFDGIYALSDSSKTVPAGDAVAIYDGTSFSAPMVSGVVSLMLSVAPNLTADQVRSILTSSAKPFAPLSTCSTSLCGAGIVNAQAAVQAAQAAAGGVNYTDLWWFGQAFNGTGISIIDHHDVLFATWYVYDGTGKGSWFVMPGGTWDATHTIFSGAMYSTRGTPFNNYSPPATLLQAGTLSLQFFDSSNGTLSYVFTSGQSAAVAMTRQPFGPVVAPTHPDYSDLWWGGTAQDGWGLTLNQHYDTLVAIWYTYGLDGKSVFYFIPDGTWVGAATLRGTIYATTGTPFGLPYNASQFGLGGVGNATFSFSDASHATFTYTIDGTATQSKPVMRQAF
jgi:serine protease